MRTFVRISVALSVMAAVLVACSSTNTSPSTTATTSTAPGATTAPSTNPASTTATSTTAAPSTNPTSTTALDQFELSLGGLGAFHFGDPLTTALPAFLQVFGPAAGDDLRHYPTLQPDGTYLSADGQYVFGAPHGREVCWTTGLCAEFGKGADGPFTFMGWTYMGGSDVAANQFHTRSRVTAGMTWAEAPSIHVDPNFCTGWANGTVDGVSVRLTATTPPFSANTPRTAATITAMHAGDVPVFVLEDC